MYGICAALRCQLRTTDNVARESITTINREVSPLFLHMSLLPHEDVLLPFFINHFNLRQAAQSHAF